MVLVFFSFLICCQVSFYGQLTYEKRLSGRPWTVYTLETYVTN